jgi:protease IV
MLRLLLVLIANLLLLVVWPLRAVRRARAAPRGAWLEIEIDGGLWEVPRRLPFWVRGPRKLALESVRQLSRLAGDDPRVQGLLFTIKHLRAGSATATSLRQILGDARAAGKRVAVYLPQGGGTRELYVASAADLVIVGAETLLSPLGFAVEVHYFRELFDKLGVEPDVLARGRYKTAGEPLTARRMSEPQREQIDALLDVAWDVLIEALASGRKVERATAERWVNEGPWLARGAVEQGLADAVCYPDELARTLAPDAEQGAKIVAGGRYARRRTAKFLRFFRPARIGVIEVHGPIVSAAAPTLLPMAVEKIVVDAAKRALEDRKVRGVVVHIDSPGGSALASDRMLHAIRALAEKKPVVAYMGDTAASGGYMVAVGAHSIIAQPTSVTGSIGVVTARFVVQPLLAKLGIGVEAVKRGAHADMHSSARHLAPGQRATLERLIEQVYRSFLAAVARGRGRPEAEIEPLAGGRVWSGRDALAHGLVDQLGGFDLALAETRKRIGDGAEELEPIVVTPAHVPTPLSVLPRLLRASIPGLSPALELAALSRTGRREPAWAWCEIQLADLGD